MTDSSVFYLLTTVLAFFNAINSSELIENNALDNPTQANSTMKEQIVNVDTVIVGHGNKKSQLIHLTPQIMALINLLNLRRQSVNETDDLSALLNAISIKQENFDRVFVNGSNNELFELLKISPQLLIDLGLLESRLLRKNDSLATETVFETRQLSNGSLLILGDNNTLTRGIVLDPQAAVKLRLSALLQQLTGLLGPESLTSEDCIVNDSKNTDIVQIGSNNKLNMLTEVGGQIMVDGDIAVNLVQQLRCILKNPEKITTSTTSILLNFTTPATVTSERASLESSTKPTTVEYFTSTNVNTSKTSTEQPNGPATRSPLTLLRQATSTPSMKRFVEKITTSSSKPVHTPSTVKPATNPKPQTKMPKKTLLISVTSDETSSDNVASIAGRPATERPYALPLPLLLSIHIDQKYVENTVTPPPLPQSSAGSTMIFSTSTPLSFTNQSTLSPTEKRCYRRACLKYKKIRHLCERTQ
uniref:Receptor L-domain domain-containing protein n=1 Tax=Glossina brevipalpis TaxID=37001 RepID=A0A1A9X4L8_9MUSC